MEAPIRLSGNFKKLKTQKKKFFVLFESGSNSGPRLEYYDTEKKFKTGQQRPKHPILLQHCLNISKRGGDQKHKYQLLLFTKDETFGMVFESEADQTTWYKAMITLRQEVGVNSQRYDHVWEVTVSGKGLADVKWLSAGLYRLYLTNKNLGFIRASQDEPDIELQLATIRSCGHKDNFFCLEIGSAAVTGPATVWMQVEDDVIAQNLHQTVISTMSSSSHDDMKPLPPIRNRSRTMDSSRRPNSMRRTSNSLGESSTLPRKPKSTMRHSTIGMAFDNHSSTQLKRRSTCTGAREGRTQSVIATSTTPFITPGDIGLRSRTDSVSSHGSHRTDNSAQSSDVENEAHASGYILSAAGHAQVKGRDRLRRSRLEEDSSDRMLKSKDITVTSEQDLLDAGAYMPMDGPVASSPLSKPLTRSSTRTSESSESAYLPMGTSPANSVASSGVGLEDAVYFDMNRIASSPGGSNKALDDGYMDMVPQGTVVRSNSTTLRPEKVPSLLSDGNGGGFDEFPQRANSVGSKPSAFIRSERLGDNYAYMDMSSPQARPGSNLGDGKVGRNVNDKSLSAPHLLDNGASAVMSSNPLLRSSRANSPAVRSNESSRSTTPRSGTPSHQHDSDLLMELEFETRSSRESLSDFRSRTSSGGSRDFYSSGFGSHDIRDRTGSCGSRDSSLRFHGDPHRPRTSTIGQETLRPRTSSFGPADMRPRAASQGTRYKDLSRRVKEKQLRQISMAEPIGKLRTSSRDSMGSGSSSCMGKSEMRTSRSQEYRTSLALPEEEYMVISPPSSKNAGSIASSPGSGGICMANTPPRSAGSGILHSTPTHENSAHHKHVVKHVHISHEVKTVKDPIAPSTTNSQATKKISTYVRSKDRSHGSSSESLSSSSSDIGGVSSVRGIGGVKSKRGSAKKSSSNMDAIAIAHSSGDKSDYIEASPQIVNSVIGSSDMDDAYMMYDVGENRASSSAFSGRDKVISPIRDDVSSSTLSTFQIVQSPIKEEDNDALFGPKPKSNVDRETLERLKDLKHEYVNVDFENKKNAFKSETLNNNIGTDKNNTTKTSDKNDNEKEKKTSESVNKNEQSLDTSLGYHSAKEHDYMEIDTAEISINSTSSDSSKNSPGSKQEAKSKSDASSSNQKANSTKPSGESAKQSKSSKAEKSSLSIGELAASRFHDYCEINFEDNEVQESSTDPIPDPFGDLVPPMDYDTGKGTKSDTSTKTAKSKSIAPLRITTSSSINRHSVKSSASESSSYTLSPTDSTGSVVVRSRNSSRDRKNVSSSALNRDSLSPVTSAFDSVTISATSGNSPSRDDNKNSSQNASGKDGNAHKLGEMSVQGLESSPVNKSPVANTTPPFDIGDVFNLGVKPSSASVSPPILPQSTSSGGDSSGEKVRRVSHGELKCPRSKLAGSSSCSSFSDNSKKSSSQTSLTRNLDTNVSALRNQGNSSSSLTSLDSGNNSKSRYASGGSGTAALEDAAGSRRSYHEQTTSGHQDTGSRDVTQGSGSSQLNYAKLDLSSSTDEPGLNIMTSGAQSGSSSSIVHRSASFSSAAENSAPVSYAQIDFEKSEQLRQAEQQKRSSAEHAPPFDCL